MISNGGSKIISVVYEGYSWCWAAKNRNENFGRTLLTIFVAVFLISWYTWLIKKSRKGKFPLPPGPRGLPLIGNLPFLEPELHRCFAKLAKTYGPIMKLRIGTKLCVVISSPSIAKEVLRDHDTIFANRDVPAAALAATYGGLDMVWSPYGPNWRLLRKVCVKEMMSNKSIHDCLALRQREVRRMIADMYGSIETPIKVGDRMYLAVMNVIMNMIWGGMIKGEEKNRVEMDFRKVVGELVDLLVIPNVSDLFPILSRFDLQGIQRKSKELSLWFDRIFKSIIDQRLEGEGKSNKKNESNDFLHILLQLKEEGDPNTSLTMNQLKALLMDVVIGGTDTTATTIEWAMAEMMHRPEMLRKVQEELDKVVGKDNMVEESHLPKLHYLDSVVKEVHRLHAVLPLLLPHCPSQSCTVARYSVPKGTKILLNIWAIHRDPNAWDNPLEFQPERFMEGTCNWGYNGNDMRYLPFGSGRRMCAGIPIAERMLMYILASLLHSFEWRLPEGTEVDLSEKFGVVLKKATPLVAIPMPRLSKSELYV
ncbi:flavonoid 3'-monooxygenase-like [Tasmannia lanceolata]|uniref:flavonoid 3'-monooxygenase-like n=1 Tax=Tasmannia lanceolata TaxID=3420 RepID=UPI00406281B0